MEYDSESSCDGRLRNSNTTKTEQPKENQVCQKDRLLRTSIATSWRCVDFVDSGPKLNKPNVANKSLSAQVMEYYHKYSQSSNLEQYFSLPTTSNYYCSVYESNPKLTAEEKADCFAQNYNSKIPKERRRWVRPPLVGESISADSAPVSYESKSVSLETKVPEEKADNQDFEKKAISPTSSIASYKPLEWDSLADVGYSNFVPYHKSGDKKLSTIERMVLNTGCSSALRLDPEGTEPTASQLMTTTKNQLKPKANSTPLSRNVSESESEAEITPIVKKHFDKPSNTTETPKSAHTFGASPTSVKHMSKKENKPESVLKKSPSMNLIASSSAQVALKRSQSELNLCAKDKHKILPKLIFNSTSSIATVVNKVTCDKVIQTSVDSDFKKKSESIGIQVSVSEDEKLPKSTPKAPQSILKGSKNTSKFKTKNNSRQTEEKDSKRIHRKKSGRKYPSTATSADSTPASTPRPDDTIENVAGRANSFEYFPGHVYENAPDDKVSSQVSSRVSSIDTGNSHSTMPNTSSSLEEKLWGQSDSLLRDLEKSLKILQSLVSANKCDKQTRQRFIHHVVTRLVSANYTDDKIEHSLEENVPWNPDDARKKVYRAEMIHSLAKKTNTTDSSDDWKPRVRKRENAKTDSAKNDKREIKDIIHLDSSSDKFDRNTDRTETDGRKARMGLRTDDDCYRDKSESSECFLPHRTYSKVNKMKGVYNLKKCERKGSVSNSTSTSNQESGLLNVSKTQSTVNSSNDVNDCREWKLPSNASERDFNVRKENTGSDSENAKLINYAEMEKKNQLVWITSEISHLLNLKKLLEQPKKLPTPKATPAKVKNSSCKRNINALMHFHDNDSTNNLERDILDTFDHHIHKQWSSHCDLTTCDPIASSSLRSVKCIRKRNSYTQTANNIECSHSKSGAEIISANKVSTQYVKITNSSAQTSSRIEKKITHTACQTQPYVQSDSNDLKSISRSCSCSQSDDKRPFISQASLYSSNHCLNRCVCKSNDYLKLKEAKNHMNSNKLKKDVEKTQQCCRCDSKTREKLHLCACKNYSSINSTSDVDVEKDYDKQTYTSCKYCSNCGVSYKNNRRCECQINYPKPVAYEISFGDKKVPKKNSRFVKRINEKQLRSHETATGTCQASNSCSCSNVKVSEAEENQEKKETLRDYLSSNKPKFVDNVETRRKYISEISQLRQLKKEKRLQLLAMSNTTTLFKSFKPVKKTKHIQKMFSDEKWRELSRQRYFGLNEVKAKRKQKEKQEALSRNKLMAKLFCKKLQQKVLRGQVDLSQSTSVISNL